MTAPDDGECGMLATMAAAVLAFVADRDDGQARRADGTHVQVIDGRQVP